jgi:hypothetical protein
VNTAVNVLVFSGAFVVQAGVGAIIQSYEVGPGSEVRFSADAYRMAFGIVLLSQVASILWLAATRSWLGPERALCQIAEPHR